jgi:general secretion pathway protein G
MTSKTAMSDNKVMTASKPVLGQRPQRLLALRFRKQPGVTCTQQVGLMLRQKPGLTQRQQAGLTLIEIMVVIVIVGVLAALIVPRVMTRPDEARAVAAKQDVASVMQALKLYRLDNQAYPTGEQGLAALVTRPSLPPEPSQWKAYLDKLPVDPWGRPDQYLNPGLKGEVDVFSLGADGKPGGSGVDADVGNWSL